VSPQRPAWLGAWARDSSVVLSSQLSALLVTTALAVLIARDLGPSRFGVLAAFQGVAQIVTVFVDAGIATYLLRELSAAWAGREDETANAPADELISAGLAAATAAAGVLIGASTVMGAAVLRDGTLAFALGGLVGYTALLACADALEVVYRARRRLRLLAAAILIEKGLLVALVGAALLANGGILAIAAGYLAAAACRLTFDLVRVRRLGVRVWRRPTLAGVKSTLGAALPFGLSSTAPTAVVRFDATLIGLFSTTAAGLYAVGDRILTVLLVIPSTGAATLFPLLARERSARETARRAALIMLAGGAVVAALGIGIAPQVVPRLFGEPYEDAVTPVRLMLLATPLIYASSMLMTGLYSLGRERLVLIVMLACTVTGTSFVVTGQLAFGVAGAAAGYALRYLGFFSALTVASARARRDTRVPGAAEAIP
jgi:O-antigen/teichoic acid export membrane protein